MNEQPDKDQEDYNSHRGKQSLFYSLFTKVPKYRIKTNSHYKLLRLPNVKKDYLVYDI